MSFFDLVKVLGLISAIKYELGIAKEGVDFISHYDDCEDDLIEIRECSGSDEQQPF